MKTVAIVRSDYPIVSEAFITEQISSLPTWSSVVLCRRNASMSDEARRIVGMSGTRSRLAGVWPSIPATEHVRETGSADLIHAHFGPDGIYADALAKASGKPFLVTFHGYDGTLTRSALLSSRQPSKLHYLFRRQGMARRATGLIAVSRFLERKLLALGFPQDKLHVHYIGIDPTKFFPAFEKPEGHIVKLLTVARLVESKAIDVALHAIGELVRSGIQCRYDVIGAGPELNRLEAISDRLALRDVVRFHGAVPHSEIANRMRRSDVFLFPSRVCGSGAEEAFGLVLAEASASGLPLVANDVGGIGEIVRDGMNGFLVEANDACLLAKRLALLIEDAELRRRFGTNGRHLVLDQFNLKTQSRKLEEMYESAIAGKL